MAFPRGGKLPAHQLLNRERIRHVVRNRRQIVEPVRIGHELVVLHVLGDFFIAAMQIANVRRRLGDHLAIQFQNDTQDAMGRGMRRAHIQRELLAE